MEGAGGLFGLINQGNCIYFVFADVFVDNAWQRDYYKI